MAVWSNRYTCFEQKITAQELIDEFIRTYKIEVEEKVNYLIQNKILNWSFQIQFMMQHIYALLLGKHQMENGKPQN